MHEKLPSSSFSRPCNKSFLCIIIIMFFQLQNDYRWSMKNALSFLKLFIPKRAINLWYFASLSIVLDSIFQTYPNARFFAPFFSFYSFWKMVQRIEKLYLFNRKQFIIQLDLWPQISVLVPLWSPLKGENQVVIEFCEQTCMHCSV